MKYFFDFFRILDIDIEEGIFRAKFSYILEWRDQRLEFKNLRQDAALNVLTQEEISQIWYPNVILDDVDLKNRFYHTDNIITVRKTSTHRESVSTEVHSTYFYEGRDNILQLNKTVSASFLCNFDVTRYPFDVQKCQLVLTLVSTQLTKYVR